MFFLTKHPEVPFSSLFIKWVKICRVFFHSLFCLKFLFSSNEWFKMFTSISSDNSFECSDNNFKCSDNSFERQTMYSSFSLDGGKSCCPLKVDWVWAWWQDDRDELVELKDVGGRGTFWNPGLEIELFTDLCSQSCLSSTSSTSWMCSHSKAGLRTRSKFLLM